VKNGHVNSMINLGTYLADTHEDESIKLYKRAAELDHMALITTRKQPSD